MRKIFIVIALSVLALLAIAFMVSEMVLPGIVSQGIEEEIKNQLQGYEELRVEVKSRPSLKFLWGNVDRFALQGKMINTEGLIIESITAIIDDIEADLIEGEYILRQGEMTGLRMVLTQDHINDYLKLTMGQDLPLEVVLEPGLTYIEGPFMIMGREVKLSLEGIFQVHEERYLVFHPQRVAVEDYQVPAFLTAELLEEAGFSIDLNRMPFPFKVEEVQVGEGKIMLLAGD